jgi:RHS repeat-associated protein
MPRFLNAILLAFLLILTASTASAYAPQGLSMSEQKVSNQFDPDGTVIKVEYYNGAVLIGTATTAPFSFTWNSVPNGGYLIRAKATDNLGDSTTTAPIKVNVGDGETITYLHNDFAGSPLAATDVAGNIVWKENYRPFGERLNSQAESTDNRQWFHGKAADADTGLQYFGARYYDPVLGRFMGVDPVGFQEDNIHSFNKYAYGNNNPYRFVDPDGNQSFEQKTMMLPNNQGALSARTVNMVPGYKESMGSAQLAANVLMAADGAMGVKALAETVIGLSKAASSLNAARAARDALSSELKPLGWNGSPAVTAGYNVKTGEVAARACSGGKCAETHVVDALGGAKENVRLTEAVRPRTGQEVPVCARCEATFGRDAFPSGTKFKSD